MVALSIAESKKPAGVELKKWIGTLFSVVINEELLTVFCRNFSGKIKKIKDTLNDF